MTAIITAAHLSKWYGQVIGLNDVTVSVPPGITGLLGPNGAGKSTFMKLVTGQLRPSQGSITVLGEPIWQNPGLYFRIGFCPEQDAFYDRMTGLEWVTALVRLNGVGEAKAAELARRALERGRPPRGGRQEDRRLQQGHAAAREARAGHRPRPRAAHPRRAALGHGPDWRGARRSAMIKDWARAGKSVIVSSHILHEIESMTSNILLINQGRILAEGNVHQIRDLIDEHPHTVFIRAERSARASRASSSPTTMCSA